jgi:hypothetical protein
MWSQVKNPVSANYETKNTSTFQLFHCQQTQSLLITLCFKQTLCTTVGSALTLIFFVLYTRKIFLIRIQTKDLFLLQDFAIKISRLILIPLFKLPDILIVPNTLAKQRSNNLKTDFLVINDSIKTNKIFSCSGRTSLHNIYFPYSPLTINSCCHYTPTFIIESKCVFFLVPVSELDTVKRKIIVSSLV